MALACVMTISMV